MAPSDVEADRPAGVKGWKQLAIDVRNQRSLDHYARVLVAGNVSHTQMTRGRIYTRLIHTYDDSGAEFNQLIAWSQHPQALAQDCHCGSGERFGVCHGLAQVAALA